MVRNSAIKSFLGRLQSVRAWNCRVTQRRSHRIRRAGVIESLELKTMLTPSLSLPSGPVDVNEDIQNGTVVATFTYTGDYVWLVEDYSCSFTVMDDGMGGGQLIMNGTMGIDYETLSPSIPGDPTSDRLVSVTVEAVDMMTMDYVQATMTIRVNDVAEDPSFAAPPAPAIDWFFNVSEIAQVGDVVGQIAVSDPQPGTSLTFDVYEGDITDPTTWLPTTLFAVFHENGNAVVKVNGMLDNETATGHDLVVVAHDESCNEAVVYVGIGVDNEPEWYATGVFLVEPGQSHEV